MIESEHAYLTLPQNVAEAFGRQETMFLDMSAGCIKYVDLIKGNQFSSLSSSPLSRLRSEIASAATLGTSISSIVVCQTSSRQISSQPEWARMTARFRGAGASPRSTSSCGSCNLHLGCFFSGFNVAGHVSA